MNYIFAYFCVFFYFIGLGFHWPIKWWQDNISKVHGLCRSIEEGIYTAFAGVLVFMAFSVAALFVPLGQLAVAGVFWGLFCWVNWIASDY